MATATTIQISEELQDVLAKRKLSDRETYEEVIWDIIEDTREINEETKRELEEARAEIKAGKVHTLEQVKKDLLGRKAR
jgi:predicted transcriptional regulator